MTPWGPMERSDFLSWPWRYKAAPHVWRVRHANNCMTAHRDAQAGVLRPGLLVRILAQEVGLARAWRAFARPVLPR